MGRYIKRYQLPVSDKYLIFMPKGWTHKKIDSSSDALSWLKNNYPAIANHLLPFANAAAKRDSSNRGEYWWELRACDYYTEFEKPKIIYPNICKRPEFALDNNGLYSNQKCFIIPRDDKYLLGILNSSNTYYLFGSILPKLRGEFYEPSYIYFKEFPIRTIDLSNPADVARHDRMVVLVQSMLDLHRQLSTPGPEHERTLLARRIEATDRQIDRLVYELYGLTEEEIELVEGSRK